ncbi:cyclic nucleotide-binding domain-containing protein, partial [bacterium]
MGLRRNPTGERSTMLLLNLDMATRKAFFQNSRFFANFDQDILDELERESSLKKYAAGETILVEGDPCGGLYNLISGSVKLFKLSPSGRELIITV